MKSSNVDNVNQTRFAVVGCSYAENVLLDFDGGFDVGEHIQSRDKCNPAGEENDRKESPKIFCT